METLKIFGLAAYAKGGAAPKTGTKPMAAPFHLATTKVAASERIATTWKKAA